MIYKTLGKTGLEVSQIGFGGIPIQQLDNASAVELIRNALALGINFFDSARGYTTSEAFIGEGLQGSSVKPYLATKSLARDKQGMLGEVETSLKNLRTEYIDLYQLHNVSTLQDFDRVMSPGGAAEALLDCKQRGLIGHIGITSHSLDIMQKSLDYEVFETIQYPYNAVEIQATEVFRNACERGLGVIAMKPFAGGALTNTGAALRFILQNKAITCAIPGMCSIKQLEENIGAADGRLMAAEEAEDLAREAAELGERFCRRCGYCQPCPSGINIPMAFILEGYYKRYNLKTWAAERYSSLPIKASDCTKCGLCETKCPYLLPIREMLDAVRNTFE